MQVVTRVGSSRYLMPQHGLVTNTWPFQCPISPINQSVSRFNHTEEKIGLLIKCQAQIFTARCYASAVLAMGLCPSVSVTSRCSIETDERIGLVFGMGASFDLSYTVL